ncbi:MAG: 4Fe-4S binding protein [Methanobacterium sp.]|jgi:epoxyqueuosine reductase QueG|nr:4Fe-4S binding protein [Methanobacterium sp.]
MKTETASSLKEEIKDKCNKLGLPMVGFAPKERWEQPPSTLPQHFSNWIPREFWPQSIYPEVRTVIVIGLPVPLPIVETAPSIYYHELYQTVNNLLDEKAYEIANYLTLKGYPSIYLPRDGYGDIDILLKRPLAFFSHKHAAFLAGLGSFGLNNVLLTPEFGPRVRFTSIFTTAKIKRDPISGEDLCTRCLSCADQCPVKAIESKYPPENSTPPPINKIKCAKRSKKLRKQYNSPCGICIKVCPVGKDREVFNRKDTSIYTCKDGFEQYHDAWKHVQSYGSKK